MSTIGVVGIPQKGSTEELAAAFRARGATAHVLRAEGLTWTLPERRVTCDGVDLHEMDAVVVKKLGDVTSTLAPVRAALLGCVEAQGGRVYGSPAAIACAVDRCTMTHRLAMADLPIPRTMITENPRDAARFVEELGAVVYKPRFTSKGRGMQILRRGPELGDALAAIVEGGGLPFYLQEFLPGVEKDMGVAVCDGEVIGAYYRVRGEHAWSTTTRTGGVYAPGPLDDELRELARAAAAAFGLVFTTVDIVRHGGRTMLYEVSAFGGFRGLGVYGVDGAGAYADAVLRRLRRSEAGS